MQWVYYSPRAPLLLWRVTCRPGRYAWRRVISLCNLHWIYTLLARLFTSLSLLCPLLYFMDNLPIHTQNDSAAAAAPTIDNDNLWSEQEISYIVDHLSNIGSFYPEICDHLATHLAREHPGKNRTAGEIQVMFHDVRVFGFWTLCELTYDLSSD